MFASESTPPAFHDTGDAGRSGAIGASRAAGDAGPSGDDGAGPRPGDASNDATLASFTTEAGLPSAPETLEVPDRIGPYEVLGELGRGGMGVVYRARDPELEREVALKVLPEQLSGDAQAFARFRGEAKLLAAVNTPHIATIYSLEKSGDRHFLSMELVPGWNLSEKMRQEPLSLEEALSITRQVAVALEAAHRSGIVHLDLKPQNIMITPEGQAKVLDFGLAMALGRKSDAAGEDGLQAMAQESVGGTPGYMSPEQIRGEAVDARADIWSFGCILYESLTGKPTFPGANPGERLRATLEGRPRLEDLSAKTPPRVRELVERCLAPEAGRRLDAMAKARRELEEAISLRALPVVAPRSEAAPNNLPAQISSFFGREAQKVEVRRLLAENRLVALTGVGGGGKTRLSLEVGRELLGTMNDGVWLVELAPLAEPELVPAAVASALGLKDAAGFSPTQLLLRHLESLELLLILDNCEHLLDPVARLCATLLVACPGLRVLATSREAMGVPGEVTFQVPSLRVPDGERLPTLEELAAFESVQLFVARAQAVQPAFSLTPENAAAVAMICRRLDGIPLAVELAAARAKVLPAEEIARRLDDRFRLLTSSNRAALPRHQTLRALIDWSYDHLAEPEQDLLRRLSLFAGGWTLEAAEAVCAGDGIEDWEVLDLLSSLVAKSLVETDAEGARGTGRARYRMLETVREYARSRLLERQEGSEVLVRHRQYFVTLAVEAETKLTGPEQPVYLRWLTAENDNLRLALDLCADPGADPELGWRLAAALGRYWHLRGQWNEGRRAYADLLSRPDAPRESAAAAGTLNWAGNLAKLQGDYPQARAYLEESLAIRRRLGNEPRIAASLNNLANVLKDQSQFEAAHALYDESLRLQRKLGNRPGIAAALNSLGVLAYIRRDYRESLGFHEEGLSLRRELGDRSGVAASLNNLGAAAEALGDIQRAFACFDESVGLQRDLGDRWGVAASLSNLGRLAEERGDLSQARQFYEEGLSTFRELGDRPGTASLLHNLGLVSAAAGERETAREQLRASLGILRELEVRETMGEVIHALGLLAVAAGEFPHALRLLAAAESIRQETGGQLSSGAAQKLGEALRALRSALEVSVFGSLWSEGLSLSISDAAQLASQGPAP